MQQQHRRAALTVERARVAAADTSPAPSVASAAAAAPAADGDEVLYDVRGNLTLLCPLKNEKNLDYVW